MKKKEKKLRIDNEILDLLKKIFEEKKHIRILSQEEKELIPKESLNYLYELREKKYLTNEKFEKIMFLLTIVSEITGEKNSAPLVSDLINFIYFLEDTDLYLNDILDMMFSDIFEKFRYKEIN